MSPTTTQIIDAVLNYFSIYGNFLLDFSTTTENTISIKISAPINKCTPSNLDYIIRDTNILLPIQEYLNYHFTETISNIRMDTLNKNDLYNLYNSATNISDGYMVNDDYANFDTNNNFIIIVEIH